MSKKEDILANVNIADYIHSTGREISRKGSEPAVCCYFHADRNPSLRFNEEKGLWRCDPCGIGGNVIDLHMQINGLSFTEAVNELAGDDSQIKKTPKANDSKLSQEKKVITYEYKDEYGNLSFMVDRIEENGKKTFRQYHEQNGKRVYKINGVRRTLYRLDRWQDKQQVFLVEGEKCVHALESAGYDATTNSGGSNGWLDAYATQLADKDVVIIPDNDAPGAKWLENITASIAGKVASVQTLRLPDLYNDIADVPDVCDMVMGLQESTPIISRGVDVPIYSSQEAYERYKASVRAEHRVQVDLGLWLPCMREHVRPLIPGEMVTVMADTGMGKSATLQNIAQSLKSLNVLYFQLELPLDMMTERFTAIDTLHSCRKVENSVKSGKDYDPSTWSHIWTCEMAGLSVKDIDDIVVQSELKMGEKPQVVMVDYIGLISGGSGSKYERMSKIAEDLKVLAKRRNVVLFVASQVRRKQENDNGEVPAIALHDAKDSGSIENSSGLVLGCWRPERDLMNIKILKNTKGSAGFVAECDYMGAALKIKERLSNL